MEKGVDIRYIQELFGHSNTKTTMIYSLWRVNDCQQDFRFVARFSLSGQERAPKPPQAICGPLATRLRTTCKKETIVNFK